MKKETMIKFDGTRTAGPAGVARRGFALLILLAALAGFDATVFVHGAPGEGCDTCKETVAPAVGVANVDGSYVGEWDTDVAGPDFWAHLYNAGNPDETFSGYALTANAFVRYKCDPDQQNVTVSVLVLTSNEESYPVLAGPNWAAHAWVKLGGINGNVVDGADVDDGNPPDFQWIDIGYDGDPEHARGYEASFRLPTANSPWNCFVIHVEVYNKDKQAAQTSGTESFNGPGRCLKVECDDVVIECTPGTTFTANCAPGPIDLGCNPTSLPECDPTVRAEFCEDNETTPLEVNCIITDEEDLPCDAGKRTITYTASNGDTCVQVYTWTIRSVTLQNVPEGGYLGCNPNGVPDLCLNVTAIDQCGNPVTVQCEAGGGGDGCTGRRTYDISASGECGAQATASVTYTWKSVPAPTIGAPGADATIYCPSTPEFTPPTAEAACGETATVVPFGDDVRVDYACGTYTLTRSWVAKLADECGGFSSQPVSQTITVLCNACTGGLTIGYWQNKNGQNQIKNAGVVPSTTVSALTAYLLGYKPFMDLSATATPTQVQSYVFNVIKAANASGASMNAMLKAQMLATALNVFFTPTLGLVKIDLTYINKPIGSATYEDTSAAFGGGNCLTVSGLLAYASDQYLGLNNWYGQVKATQELAKDTFDAINNSVAYACP